MFSFIQSFQQYFTEVRAKEVPMWHHRRPDPALQPHHPDHLCQQNWRIGRKEEISRLQTTRPVFIPRLFPRADLPMSAEARVDRMQFEASAMHAKGCLPSTSMLSRLNCGLRIKATLRKKRKRFLLPKTFECRSPSLRSRCQNSLPKSNGVKKMDWKILSDRSVYRVKVCKGTFCRKAILHSIIVTYTVSS